MDLFGDADLLPRGSRFRTFAFQVRRNFPFLLLMDNLMNLHIPNPRVRESATTYIPWRERS